jgi:hypothetical protein
VLNSAVLRASAQPEDRHFAVGLFEVPAIAWGKLHDLTPNRIALGPDEQLCFDWELSITQIDEDIARVLGKVEGPCRVTGGSRVGTNHEPRAVLVSISEPAEHRLAALS